MKAATTEDIARKDLNWRCHWTSWVVLSVLLCFLVISAVVPGLVRVRKNRHSLDHDPSTELAATCADLSTDSHGTSLSSSLFAAEILGLNGTIISDCCCSFDEIDETNANIVRPLLSRIVTTSPFFAYFRIDLCSDCPLWSDLQPFCVMKDCSVCECDEPPEWALVPTNCSPPRSDDIQPLKEQSLTLGLDFNNDAFLPLQLSALGTSRSTGSIDDNEKDDEGVVVDLRLNPEMYTGYDGESAERVWSTIHEENCFQPQYHAEGGDTNGDSDDGYDAYCLLPAEQRLYNRLISGLHSSISLHIAHTYCLEMDADRPGECRVWGTNNSLAKERVLNHRDRLENLYFAFSLLLRAVIKAGSEVTAAVPPLPGDAGTTAYDPITEWKHTLLPELTRMDALCPRTFDESIFAVPGTDIIRLELQRRFHHLQRIMQCVGCERCKLWGTLQALGVGTALRVLFHDFNSTEELSLSRQEAVALVHTLERFSSSLVYAHEFLSEER
mmetsp:Transcript_34383/g.75265  ORF Transcript_34383/g.75265 Transcript_34383/m.75265 type:complete len:498 (+) Transcript_34383:277-1770(+)